MSVNKSILKVSLTLVPPNNPPGSQARQDDLMPRLLAFSSTEERFAVGRSSSGRSPVPSLFNVLFHSRSVSRRHAELSIDPRTNLLMVEDLRSMHGTYLNQTKLASGITHYVHSGDVLQFGSDIQHGDRGHFTPRTFKVSYGSAPPATKHTVPIQARRPGSFKVPETTTDEEEEDSEVEVLDSTDTSFVNSSPKASGVHPVEIMSDSEDEIQVLRVTKRTPAGIALKDLFTDDDDECATPLPFQAVPSTFTPQATVEHLSTGSTGTQPSQERMRISNILADVTEVVSESFSQESDEGARIIDLDQDIPDPEAELELELLSDHQTVPYIDVVQDDSVATTAIATEVQKSHGEDASADIQVADVVLPFADSVLDDASKAQDAEQIRTRLELLTRTLPEVKAYLAGVENPLATRLSKATKRPRDDTPTISSIESQLQIQPGDMSADIMRASGIGESANDELTAASSKPARKRARHAAPVISIPITLPKHDSKVAAPATWQATVKPFMLGALVGGMGVFGGLLSMADMQ